jgi:tetratricopeptide (TPR) repeat protein
MRAVDRGFAEVRDTLGSGLSQLGRTIESGFQQLTADFSWGLSELMWRADQQNQSLAEIRDLLTRPLDVQSKELRSRAVRSYDNGWMDEALDDFQEAIKKSRVDYVVAHYLGNIYLRRKNYEAAADWFGKSARWSRPEEPRHAAVALMHQALALLLSRAGSEAGDSRDAIACLDDALNLDPANIEVRFQRAQLRARAGSADLAVTDLEEAIDHDGRYLARALMEPDFQQIGDQIAVLVYWLTKSYSKTIERHLRLFTSFLRQFDEGIAIDNHVTENDDSEAFAQAVSLAASLYAAEDFHSVKEAQDLLLALPYPETRQRITGTYGATVEQVGREKAAVSLTRLYSLERLAQDRHEQRQAVVDEVCDYLRKPFAPLDSRGGSQTGAPTGHDSSPELQWRQAAQRLLARHLRAPNSRTANNGRKKAPETYWPGIRIELANATLVDADFSQCHFQNVNFHGAVFHGDAWFAGSSFGEEGMFAGARFKGDAIFGGQRFGNVIFEGRAIFDDVSIAGDAWFGGARFCGGSSFGHVTFGGLAAFVGATFRQSAKLRRRSLRKERRVR